MAILNADGIVFQNGTTLTSKYGIIPKDTVQIFYQASAPTGWTQVTHHDPLNLLQPINNKALRVVSGTGGGFNGSTSFTSVFSSVPITGSTTLSGQVGNTTLDTTQLPIHDHGAGGTSNQFTASASTSPFRTEVRVPVSYAFRSEYRQIVNSRALINFRQPTTVRQPSSYRQPRNYGTPINVQQPRNTSIPYSFNFRSPSQQPYTFRSPFNFQQPRNQQRPYSFQQPRNQQNPNFFSIQYNFRAPIRPITRQPRARYVTFPSRQPRAFQFPVNTRVPASFPFPYSTRLIATGVRPVRTPYTRNYQRPASFRVPYTTQQPVSARAIVNFRTAVDQRNPSSYRQPRTYRVSVRYPVTTNVRYATRVLTPGGSIRGDDQNGPLTSAVGGGLAHNHSFVGSPASISGLLNLRVQYIDVIVCKFD